MPIGTCDPATRGDAFNTQDLSRGNGLVTATVKYGWDGISTRATGCDGPLAQSAGWAIRVVNNDTQTWYLHTVGRRGQPHVPGTTTTYTAGQASAAGYATISDIAELTLTTSPTG